jgi:hypothetical protein
VHEAHVAALLRWAGRANDADLDVADVGRDAPAKTGRRHGSVAEAGWANAVGVALLLAAIALGLAAAAP